MGDMIRVAAPAPKQSKDEFIKRMTDLMSEERIYPAGYEPRPEPDPRIKRLRSLRDGLQRNTVAVTRIIDELIGEMESEEDAA